MVETQTSQQQYDQTNTHKQHIKRNVGTHKNSHKIFTGQVDTNCNRQWKQM